MSGALTDTAIVQAVSAGNDAGAGPSADIQDDAAADSDTDEMRRPNRTPADRSSRRPTLCAGRTV